MSDFIRSLVVSVASLFTEACAASPLLESALRVAQPGVAGSIPYAGCIKKRGSFRERHRKELRLDEAARRRADARADLEHVLQELGEGLVPAGNHVVHRPTRSYRAAGGLAEHRLGLTQARAVDVLQRVPSRVLTHPGWERSNDTLDHGQMLHGLVRGEEHSACVELGRQAGSAPDVT